MAHAASPLFSDPPLPEAEGRARLDAAFMGQRAAFPNKRMGRLYYKTWITPPSGRWAFKSNGKTGTSSALAFLFWAEFGVALTTKVATAGNLSSDVMPHMLDSLGAFRRAHLRRDMEDLAAGLSESVRISTVRHPVARLLSGFAYICRSHEGSSEQFADERLRLSVLTGFDWTTEPHSAAGLEKFVSYIAGELADAPGKPVNNHWTPQHLTLRPDVMAYEVIGKTEDMGAFYADIAERFGLDRARAGAFGAKRKNENAGATRTQIEIAPSLRKEIETLFAADFDAFGYDWEMPK